MNGVDGWKVTKGEAKRYVNLNGENEMGWLGSVVFILGPVDLFSLIFGTYPPVH